MRLRLASWRALLIPAGGAADAIAVSMTRPFTLLADITTAVAIAGTLAFGLTAGGFGQQRRDAATSAGGLRSISGASVAAWSALVAALATFELINLFESPRAQHPTISSLLTALTGHEITRGLLFAAWLAAGWWVCRRS